MLERTGVDILLERTGVDIFLLPFRSLCNFVHPTLHQFITHWISSSLIASVHPTLHQFIPHCLISSSLIASVHPSLHQFIPHCISSSLIALVHPSLHQFTACWSSVFLFEYGTLTNIVLPFSSSTTFHTVLMRQRQTLQYLTTSKTTCVLLPSLC